LTIDKPLLEINNLHVGFRIKDDFYDAVDNVSLTLEKNEILAIVGESGCGKSTLATTIMGLHNKNNTKITGDIIYNDVNLVNLNEALYNKIRGNDIGMIFQDPLASLNPLMTIGAQIDEALYYHTELDEKEIQHYHTLVEEKLRDVLLRLSYYLKRGDGRNQAQLVNELDQLLEDALKLVYLDHSDHLFHQTDYHIHYFEMRQRQTRILRNMAQQINTCQLAASESLIVAQLFSKTASQLSQTNPAYNLLNDIESYLEVFRKRSLPKTREEFETRATLLQLFRELEHFIQIKVDFYNRYSDKNSNK